LSALQRVEREAHRAASAKGSASGLADESTSTLPGASAAVFAQGLFLPCAVIPVYNHERAVGKVLAAICAAGLPCVMVDDASSAECAGELDRLAAAHPQVSLVRLPVNLGKGGAVAAGLRAARDRGFTHALQIDADGQHAISDVSRFIEEGRAHPHSLVCGRPVFDGAMPSGRFYGRYLTHVFVWLNTLSFDIPDSMCGFRVYPLLPVLKLLDSTRLGSRMDFDVEVLVRLHWREVPMRWLDTRVSYPLDGVSHFRMVWDNVLMVRLQLKLLAGMLVRLPLLLWRKVR
jgi:glycosyltransferase involved in cell wall biosynthesis